MIDPLQCGPAMVLLAGSDERLAAMDAGRFDLAWLGLLAVSALWGLASVGLWHGSDSLSSQSTGLHVAPAVALAITWMLGLYPRAAASLAGFLGRGNRQLGGVAATVIVAVFLAVLLVLAPDWHRQEPSLPGWIAWVRPASKVDRVLLLLPMWGAWAMMILPQFRRPDAAAEPQLAALARGGGPLTGAVVMGLLLAASIGAFAFLPWTQLAIPGAGVVAAIFGGLVMSHIRGRMDRSVLLAANMLTQLAMLLAYLAVRNPRYW
jgi:hypothetical protein